MNTAFALKRVIRRKPVKQETDCVYLQSVIQKIKNDLENVQNLFDSVTEPELVDSYTYELKALKIKYCYYLNLYKKYGKEPAL